MALCKMLDGWGQNNQEVISREMLKLAYPVSRFTLTELPIQEICSTSHLLYKNVKMIKLKICSTSPSGGSQDDGFPPASSSNIGL